MAPRCLPERRLSASCRIRPDAGGRQVQAGGEGGASAQRCAAGGGNQAGTSPRTQAREHPDIQGDGAGEHLEAVPQPPSPQPRSREATRKLLVWSAAETEEWLGRRSQHGPVSSNSVPGSGNHAVSGSHWSPRNHSWGGRAGQARAICAHLRLSALQSGDWRL